METFVLGAAYSGKSEWALTQLNKTSPTAVLGTAVIQGLEERIKRLKSIRPGHWIHYEHGDIQEQLREALESGAEQILIDSLNQWLANYLLESWLKYDKQQHESRIDSEVARIFQILDRYPNAHVITVSSEVGSGITPPDELSRFFRSSLGLVNQKFAARAKTVVHIVAGLPIFINKV